MRPLKFAKTWVVWLFLLGSALAQNWNWSDPVLVDSINGVIMDFNPSLSPDGQTMYFTTGNRIMVSYRSGDTWGAPTMLGPNINSGQRQVKATVTPDNRTLYFTSWRAGGLGTYNIWKSNWDDSCDCWGVPEVLPEPLNTPYMEWDVQLSLDGMYMYFTSDRSFGLGFNDIWCSDWDTLTENWGEPYNLGGIVNSSSIDECPYPFPGDNNKIYFSSLYSHGFEGWQGGRDIFIAYKRNGSWDSLTILPSPINTIHHESSSAITPDGLELYIASTRIGGAGADDIFVSYRMVGIEESNGRGEILPNDLFIYPNPVTNYVLFSSLLPSRKENSEIIIFNLLGQIIMRVNLSQKGNFRWDLNKYDNSHLPNGIYFAVGRIGNHVVSQKFTVIK